MTPNRLVHIASLILAVLTMAASVSAATITYSTNAPGTGFGGSSLFLNNSLGASATLTYTPDVSITSGVPSNVNFGKFTLACGSCSTQNIGAGSFFNPFTFNLLITESSPINATGMFVGTSAGGAVWSDVSQISINWAPLQLGPGANGAISGNFGTSIFTTSVFTGIVAPNSGTPNGVTTVQGHVADSAVPEPATLGLIGGGLLALGMLRRKRLARP